MGVESARSVSTSGGFPHAVYVECLSIGIERINIVEVLGDTLPLSLFLCGASWQEAKGERTRACTRRKGTAIRLPR